ncbi:phosphopantetheine-binding protein, partial [Pseudonocardia eucalypti]|uniref:phosphopantetheine-binding protein n=1 Tax=Pseudonocardia eucalypti TaxID=648755 RepID=UPI0031EFCB9C
MSLNTLGGNRAPEWPQPTRCTDATTQLERTLGELLADVTKAPQVSVNSHFFRDLDADSMRMAHFCARVRKHPDLPAISMKDVYRNPTVRGLTRAVSPTPSRPKRPPVAPLPTVAPASTVSYLTCGAVQVLLFLGAAYLGALLMVTGFQWISTGIGWVHVYERAVVFGLASLAGFCLLPILAKWVLIGRWKPTQIRVWSLRYLRFWLVKTLIRVNPMVLFVGTPLYTMYLRALGAKIGPGVIILSNHVPVCTDLLTIGTDTIIRKDSYFSGYRAHAGVITTGRVTLGDNVLVSESTVLDINTWMSTGSQLGHASSLHPGQTVPPNQRWHGCPARPGRANYRTLPPIHRVGLRRFLFSTWQVLRLVLFGPPVLAAMFTVVKVMLGDGFTQLRPGLLSVSQTTFYLEVLVVSVAIFFDSFLFALLYVGVVPRILSRFLVRDRVYPLYGIHYWLHRTVTRMTNTPRFTYLLGDSSYIVNFLRWIGYDLSHVVQSGSNFGLDVKQDHPKLTKVGSGTMIADGLSVINSDY